MEQRRLEMLQAREAGMTVVEVCRLYEVSRETFYVWQRRYDELGVAGLADRSSRPARSPWQTRPRVERLVVSYRAAHQRWGPRRIAAELRRRDGISDPPAVSTIQTILVRNEMLVSARRPEPAPPPQRFERSHPNELWQTDGKEVAFVWGAVEIVAFLDDCSRCCLAIGWFETVTSTAMTVVFDAAVANAGGLPRQVLADREATMTGRTTRTVSVFERHLWCVGVMTINGRGYHPQTQGKIERFWRTLNEWLDEHPVTHPDGLDTALDRFRDHYNQERPHQALPGDMTPAERFAQLTPVGPDPLTAQQRNQRTSIRTVGPNGVVAYSDWLINLGRAWAHAKVVLTDNGFTITLHSPDGTPIRTVEPDYSIDYYPAERDPLLNGRPPATRF